MNIFTPACDLERRPVMVWLHGGAWWAGAGSAPGYDGSTLSALGDVVVVTVNHRLGLFGFLQLDETGGPFENAGTAGVLDIVAALRWIRENIVGFGGDPGNVTIFGQSGGGAKVAAIMACAAAKGLFHKAIAQSCSGSRKLASPEEGRAMARALADRLLLPRVSASALQAVPMERLVAASKSLSLPFRPILDGRTFQGHPFDTAAPDCCQDVPFMTGTTMGETRLLMAADPRNFALEAEEVYRRLARFLRIDRLVALQLFDAFKDLLPNAQPSDVLARITSDYCYVRNTRAQAKLMAEGSRRAVYCYNFAWNAPTMGGLLQAPHTVEIPFVFGTVHAADALVGRGADLMEMTEKTMAAWVRFAYSGNPSNDHMPHWPPYRSGNPVTMVIDRTCRVEDGDGQALLALLEDLPPYEYSMPFNYHLAG